MDTVLLSAAISSFKDIFFEGRVSALCGVSADKAWDESAAKQFLEKLEELAKKNGCQTVRKEETADTQNLKKD